MKKTLLLTAAILLGAAAPVTVGQEKELGVTLDVQYHSKWLSKGAEGYGQQGALFKTLDLDLYGSGFGVKITHRNSTSSGYVDKERFDFRPYYKNKLFEEQPYATNYNISVGYEYYPGLARHKANTTLEWVLALSWPNLLQCGLVPRYTAHYEYPVSGGDRYNYITGWVHRFGLGYDIQVDHLPKPIHFSTELAYTDGLGGAAHDWSYFNVGLSTGFDINENLTFSPGIYHQVSMDKSVSRRKDITYCILGMKYKF
jgi:hypothetical protein